MPTGNKPVGDYRLAASLSGCVERCLTGYSDRMYVTMSSAGFLPVAPV